MLPLGTENISPPFNNKFLYLNRVSFEGEKSLSYQGYRVVYLFSSLMLFLMVLGLEIL